MAVTQSPRLGLTRWSAGTDAFRRAQLDADHAALDDLVAISLPEGTFNARPAAGVRGRFYHATDAPGGGADGLVYYDTGAKWVLVGSPPPDLSPYARTADLDATYATDADVAAVAAVAGAALPKVNGTLTGYRETVVATGTAGTVTLDLAAGNVFRLAPTGAVTIAIAGGVAGVAQAFTLVVTNSTYAITWPAGTRFPDATPPTLNGETWISGIRDSNGNLTVGLAWSGVA